jgi:iron complex transport system substrate-binding protein
MRLIYLLVIVVGLVSCQQNTSHLNIASIVAIEKPEYAKGFEIQHLADSSLLIVLFNLEKPGDTLQKIHWQPREVNSIACVSTTHISMLDHLNRLHDLKGVGFADRVLNKHARERIDSGLIADISTGEDIDAEIIYGMQPQLLFVYPFGGQSYNKFLKRGIGCVQISEYLEPHPLGRAEWIKVFGALLNEAQRADSVFKSIEIAYNALKNRVEHSAEQKPTVFTATYSNGHWFAPPGNSFIAQAFADAGAQYIYADSIKAGNIVLPYEKLYEQVYDVDYWGKITFAPSELTMQQIAQEDERLTRIKSYQQGNIFYCNAATTDYHGDAIMEPHIILADLIAIFHGDLLPQHSPVYFRGVRSKE